MAPDHQPAPRGGERHDGDRPEPGVRRSRRHDDEHPDDSALDRLADRGPSRVGVEGAMRARDVSRPPRPGT
jgi:hypothetical protein